MTKLQAKLLISADALLMSGLHIGTSSAFSAIGATDSPVIRDPMTNNPLIPGSSLKGKMRSLLAKVKNDQVAVTPNEDHPVIRRLFGDTEENKQSRLIFRDLHLLNKNDLKQAGASNLTEVKFENTIDRRTATATPRQIERAIAGSVFGLELVYDVYSLEELIEDFTYLQTGLQLIEMDYLGGSGSRGYGKVTFEAPEVKVVIGELPSDVIEELNTIIQNN